MSRALLAISAVGRLPLGPGQPQRHQVGVPKGLQLEITAFTLQHESTLSLVLPTSRTRPPLRSPQRCPCQASHVRQCSNDCICAFEIALA